MTIVELRCKPFVRDYLNKKYGNKIRITAKGVETAHLRGLMATGSYKEFHLTFTEKYPSKVEIEFPHLFIWKSGKVGIPHTSVMDFNSFIRDQIAEGMNNWMDLVCQTVNHVEADLILNYLIQVAGVEEENINLDTWKKIRQRHKVELNDGRLLKKEVGQIVPEKVKLSFTHAKP